MDQQMGIRMCKYKEVRKDYGTIHYEQSHIEVPELKVNYNELFELKRSENLPELELDEDVRIIEVKDRTKQEKIDEIIEEPRKKESEEEQQKEEEQEKQEELSERLHEEAKEKKTILLEKEEQEQQEKREKEEQNQMEREKWSEEPEPEPEPEPSVNEEQKGGGALKKRIFVTNLSVDKDKEMFQM